MVCVMFFMLTSFALLATSVVERICHKNWPRCSLLAESIKIGTQGFLRVLIPNLMGTMQFELW